MAKVARIIDFLKVIIWGPRLADQGWSGPRGSYNFKKIYNPGNFGVFVLFLVVKKIDNPGNFGVFVLFLVVWPKLPGLSMFLKL